MFVSLIMLLRLFVCDDHVFCFLFFFRVPCLLLSIHLAELWCKSICSRRRGYVSRRRMSAIITCSTTCWSVRHRRRSTHCTCCRPSLTVTSIRYYFWSSKFASCSETLSLHNRVITMSWTRRTRVTSCRGSSSRWRWWVSAPRLSGGCSPSCRPCCTLAMWNSSRRSQRTTTTSRSRCATLLSLPS